MAETPRSAQPVARLSGLDLSCGRLFDQVPCYISIQDRDFSVLEANAKMLADFDGPIGQKCDAVYKGRQERCPECAVARTFEDGREHTSEEVLFDRRGLPHDVIVHTRPLRDGTGQVLASSRPSAAPNTAIQRDLLAHTAFIRLMCQDFREERAGCNSDRNCFAESGRAGGSACPLATAHHGYMGYFLASPVAKPCSFTSTFCSSVS